MKVVIADTLAGADVDDPDVRLAEMLAAHVRQTIASGGIFESAGAHWWIMARLPNRSTGCAMQSLGSSAVCLGAEVATVVASSMERRAGAEYDFNEPLLENLDQLEGFTAGELIVSLFFLLPGRHAGAAGDVAEICDALVERAAFSRIEMTPLFGEHPVCWIFWKIVFRQLWLDWKPVLLAGLVAADSDQSIIDRIAC